VAKPGVLTFGTGMCLRFSTGGRRDDFGDRRVLGVLGVERVAGAGSCTPPALHPFRTRSSCGILRGAGSAVPNRWGYRAESAQKRAEARNGIGGDRELVWTSGAGRWCCASGFLTLVPPGQICAVAGHDVPEPP